jgi:hypothetical protein
MHTSGKRLTLLSATALLLAGGGWMWLQEASAAINIPPPGTIQKCTGSRSHIISVNNGPSVLANTLGAIKAEVGETTTLQDGRQSTALTVLDTLTEGRVDGVGDLVITVDKSRPSVASSLTSNQRGQQFPATQTMRFYPEFILNGESFRSATPVNVVNSNVGSFPPAKGTVYVLTNSMVLRSDAGNTITLQPGKAFSITGSS